VRQNRAATHALLNVLCIEVTALVCHRFKSWLKAAARSKLPNNEVTRLVFHRLISALKVAAEGLLDTANSNAIDSTRETSHLPGRGEMDLRNKKAGESASQLSFPTMQQTKCPPTSHPLPTSSTHGLRTWFA
jgi:hypothetical protein